MAANPESVPVLRRAVSRARRRPGWRWPVVATGAGINLVVLSYLMGLAAAPEPTIVSVEPPAAPPAPRPIITMPPPLVVVAQAPPAPPPAPPPPRFGDLGPCPAPHRAAVAGRVAQPPADLYNVIAMSASPTDSRRVALWSERHVYVTDDGGRRWVRVLDGTGVVRSVAFDCHGRVFALRDGLGLGVRHDGGERWRPVPYIRLDGSPYTDDHDTDLRFRPILIGGGREMAVAGSAAGDGAAEEARAGITGDGGQTWRLLDLGWYEGAGLVGAWTGDTLRVLVPWTDCMSEGIRRITAGPDGVVEDELPWMDEPALDGARVHGLTWQGCTAAGYGAEEAGLCTWQGGAFRITSSQPSGDLVDGPVDVLVDPDGIHPIGTRGAGRARPWDGDRVLGTDASGRLWGEAHGELVRK